jgi:hydroxymethylglutaryl-CoA reductase
LVANTNDALGDNMIANNLRQQAAKMEAEAKGLMAESQNLMKQASALDPAQPEAPKKRAYTKKVVTEQVASEPVAKVRKTKSKVNV